LIKTFDAERLKEIVTFLNHSRAHRGLCEALLYVYDEEPLSFRHHPLDVDIKAFSVSEVLKRFQEQQDLIIWSLEFGDLLFERDAFWSELRRRFKERPVLPSPQTALDRAKRAERRLTELEGQGDTDALQKQTSH
jgi:hypothetical protein